MQFEGVYKAVYIGFDSVDQCIIVSEVLTHTGGLNAQWYIVVICVTDNCAVLLVINLP